MIEAGGQGDRERRGHADPVVGSERGVLGLEDLAAPTFELAHVPAQADRIRVEVMCAGLSLLAHHVHVALDREDLAPDPGSAAGNTNDHVAGGVGLGRPRLARRDALEVSPDALLVQRRPRNPAQRVELLPQLRGLEPRERRMQVIAHLL